MNKLSTIGMTLALTLTYGCTENFQSNSAAKSAVSQAGASGEAIVDDAAAARSVSLNRDSIPLGKLPSTISPLAYAIELEIDPDQDKFVGHIDIAATLNQSASFVFLHGKDLNVSSAKVLLSDGQKIQATYQEVHRDGVVRLDFGQTIEAGNIALEFDYSAELGDKLHSLYKVEEGQDSYVFTQMESVYAREAFPGFDEPRFKTPFEITVVVPQSDHAIGNTPVIEEVLLDNDLKRVKFATTKAMTTYLFALAIGPFDIVESEPIPVNDVRKKPIPFRGIAARGKGPDLAYAMAETGEILEALEIYFDQPHPYRKIDIIAVPDFEAGAMENIGAITFRENLLLLKDDAPPQQKRAFASVMAHELAHMWFGNLVTMPWWDDIWLNESFATWMSYKAVEVYDPDQRPEIAELKRTQRAMNVDALTSARQIREPVVDNDGIVEAFDGITYAKGGAVLTMFEQYIGKDTFRQGMRDHMNKFAHGNADVNDLIRSLSTASHQDLAPAFESFLFQSGIPQVAVSTDCEAGTLTLEQTRYLPVGSEGDSDRQWKIPVCLKYSVAGQVSEQCTLLEKPQQTVDLQGQCPDWVLPNVNFSGYYHWVLPLDAMNALSRAGDNLNQREWMSVADSARAGFANGTVEVNQLWPMIETLSRSSHPNVARSMIPTVEYMDMFLSDDPKLRWSIRNSAADLFRELRAYRAFDRQFVLGLADNEERLHYSNVAGFMAETLHDQESRAAALAKAREYMASDELAKNVSKSSLDTVLSIGVQDGGVEFFDKLLAQLNQSTDGWFRATAIRALAKTSDPTLGQRLRKLALSDQLRSNEIITLIGASLEERSNLSPTWQWFQDNYEEIAEKMPPRHLSYMPNVLVKPMCDQYYAKPLDGFFRVRFADLPGGTRALDTALESMAICAASVPAQARQAREYFNRSINRR